MLAGVLSQRPFQCCIYLKSVASDASWGKDPLWLRPEEGARGARRTNSEQRSALGVTESQQGYTKQLSFQGQSHSVKRSTKLILELVTGSEANQITGPIGDDYNHTRPLWFKSEVPEAFRISRKLWMGCESEGIKLHASVRGSPGSNRHI